MPCCDSLWLKPVRRKKMDEKTKQDLTLLLIYLTGWEEDKRNSPGEKVFRAWKGYKFEILDEIQNQQLIFQIPGGKSLILTDKGKQKAEELRRQYL
jgi:hypothetical protein